VIERFDVWKNTYKLEPLSFVIFEHKNQAYVVGKDNYTLEDLNPIDTRDKEGKYHQFRTILRKHNVARRENAFEVLVNLFLCKIVGEENNTDDLNFYWKGIAYDSYFNLVDRLQNLYKIGMERFLKQDVIYISNDEIDGAFLAVKNDKNSTKKRIKELFTQLKLYKGLDFDFIKVHNKALFEKNAKVLIEIVQIWQDSQLKTDAQNQFLGDMFEYFLDNGIKQSEGQFFTPMPIFRFILMALPLNEVIKHSEYAPKMIDYACGAGHFLNEYATQIKPLVNEYKQLELNHCYTEIVGIEKEDRLAKVAKVSAFMYGQAGINIIDADALATHDSIKNDRFNVLVTNPPFAVEGFLETLDEADRENYELLTTVSDVINNRNVQCFFIERAAQLLAPKGIAGIIVPSSVLSNSDSTHIGAREILLKSFDIIALVELGSGTFGKTGTNTVVLFLRRKDKQPTEAQQYKNRVDDWFNQDQEADIYEDGYIIKYYCQQIGVDFEHYQTLLNGTPSSELLAYELFVDYKADFDKRVVFKTLNTKYEKQLVQLPKNPHTELSKQQQNKEVKLTDKEIKEKVAALLQLEKDKLIFTQQLELNGKFLEYLRAIEKDKLFYFALAYHNPQKVLVVKSPSDNKEQKAFLDYEWSSAKGNEGIKLTTERRQTYHATL
jgi:type I restriction enzyme M protein